MNAELSPSVGTKSCQDIRDRSSQFPASSCPSTPISLLSHPVAFLLWIETTRRTIRFVQYLFLRSFKNGTARCKASTSRVSPSRVRRSVPVQFSLGEIMAVECGTLFQEPHSCVPAHASLLSGPSSVIATALEYLTYFNIYISRVPCLHDLDYPSHLPYKYI